MQATVSKRDQYWLISYRGNASDFTPGPLPEVISAVKSGINTVIIDLTNLRTINRVGVKCLLDSINLSSSRNVTLGIISPKPDIRRILKLNGLTPETPIFYDQNRAISMMTAINSKKSSPLENADHLLIVQQEIKIGMHLRKAFKAHPMRPEYRINIARDLDHALILFERGTYDCVMMDAGVRMMQFKTFIETIRCDNSLPCTPVLIVATDDLLQAAELMIRHGAHDMIRFPFAVEELYTRLQLLISYIKDHTPAISFERGREPRGAWA